jgi:hypothetical protein
MTFMIFALSCRYVQNVGLHFETWNAGVLGPVTLKGLNEGTRDLSRQKWSYKVYDLYDFCSNFYYEKIVLMIVTR